MTISPIESPSTDQNVTAVIKLLRAYLDQSLNEVILGSGIDKSKMIRRRRDGGWTADEISRLAAHFGVTPQAFYDGPDALMTGLIRKDRTPPTSQYLADSGMFHARQVA